MPDKLAEFNAMNEAELAEKTREQLHDIIQKETELMKEENVNPPKVEVH